MENEIRYYLRQIKAAMAKPTREAFTPQYMVTAVKLPTGFIELAVNSGGIEEKIDYILEAYDQDMLLKTNKDIRIANILIV